MMSMFGLSQRLTLEEDDSYVTVGKFANANPNEVVEQHPAENELKKILIIRTLFTY